MKRRSLDVGAHRGGRRDERGAALVFAVHHQQLPEQARHHPDDDGGQLAGKVGGSGRLGGRESSIHTPLVFAQLEALTEGNTWRLLIGCERLKKHRRVKRRVIVWCE